MRLQLPSLSDVTIYATVSLNGSLPIGNWYATAFKQNHFTGRAKVGKLDVDDHSSFPMLYGIRGIPTLLFFKAGEVVDQLVGVVSTQLIADKLNALVAEEVALAN